jgi:DNA-binding CsgD family transcriptional regulator
MSCQSDYPWTEMHEFLIDCGREQSPRELAAKTMVKIHALIPYDCGRIYLLNENGEVYDDMLFDVDQRWPRAYYDYYSQIENGKYSLCKRSEKNGFPLLTGALKGVYDWGKCGDDEFLSDYIRPQGIRHSFGFALYDMRTVCKKICMLDRTGPVGFSRFEQDILSILISHLENLHRNFYIGTSDECAVGRKGSMEELTARESEISDLICKGFSPEKIAQTLFLSRATVYKHIAHIHAKLGVSNRQELIVKLLHGRSGKNVSPNSIITQN